jgi:PIN domain nuclease of toxin-antitoxin system
MGLLDLSAEAAYAGAELPLIHKDPFDRLLIGQAVVHGLTVITPDRAFERYGVATLW